MSRLMARTGYGQEHASEALATAWGAAVPAQLAPHARPGLIRRGVLEVLVTHSAIVQEFNFHKQAVIQSLQGSLPTAGITDIRCRLSETGS
jgi:predicted nucleic acid-binding Zn ribbon protein